MARVVIVGGGISGLSMAWHIKRLKPEWDCLILEAGKRSGGKAWTAQEDGFLIEKGVNGFLDNKPATLELIRQLGLTTLKSRDAARKRFVLKHAQLVKLPETPQEFLTSPILSLPAKLRVMCEPFIPPKKDTTDETLADFAIRRLGKGAFEWLIDPMATGIFAGDPHKLSLKTCFPRINELETTYGSLIKAMLALKKKAKKQGEEGPKGAGPGGTLTSFRGGIEEMVEALRLGLGDSLRLEAEVKTAIKKEDGWEVVLSDSSVIEATHLVMAAPAKDVSKIFLKAIPELASLTASIDYPPVAVVALGMKKEQISHNLNGFGFLIPGRERRKILGCLWDSAVFENRAPDGYALIRILVGGARNRQMLSLDDPALLNIALKDLNDIIGIKTDPDFISIHRWDQAIPQYVIGHETKLKKINKLLKQEKRLYMRANWLGGVSLNDCVANSENLAKQLASK